MPISRKSSSTTAFSAGRFEAAISAFDTAYRLKPNPRWLYQMAVTYAAMGQPAKALESYEGFVSFADPSKDAADIANAKAEAGRCLSCGECNGCDNCYRYCPDMAVIKQNGKYEVNLDFCKGCLVCFQECPRHAIEVVESPFQGGKSFWKDRVQNFKITG